MVNRVTGLRPMGDRPSAGRRNSTRVDAPTAAGIRAPGLRPTATPVDVYARPQAPAQGNDFLRLADALGQINPTISNFLNEEAARQRKDAEDRAAKRIGGMSFEEAQNAVKNGMPEMDNPWFKAAFMKTMGERTAYSRMNELSLQYATDPNRHEIDFSSYVREQTSNDIAAFDDPHFNSGYLPAMDSYEVSGGRKHVEVQSNRTMEEAQANVFGVFLGQAQQARAQGTDPKQVAADVFSRYAGNEQFLKLDRTQQDALMMDVIGTIANDGDWELVNALLSQERTDEFGNKTSLATSPQYATKTAGIIDRARTAQREKLMETSVGSLADLNMLANSGNATKEVIDQFNAENPGLLTPQAQVELITRSERNYQTAQEKIAEADQKAALQLHAEQTQAVVAQSNLAAVQNGTAVFLQDIDVPDGKGGTETLTVKQQQDKLATDLMNYVKAQGEATGASPEQILDMEVKLFATAGVTNPRWAQTIAGGLSQATPANLKQFLESGETVLPPGLSAGIELYEQLYTKSPLLLNRYFNSSDDRRFFDLVMQGKQLGHDNYAAVRQANQALMNGPVDHPLANMTSEQARSALSNIGVGGFAGFFAGEPTNSSYAVQRINDDIKYSAAVGGVVGDAAKDAAVERFKNTHVNINGYYVNVAGEQIGDKEQFRQSVNLVMEELMAEPRYLNGKQIMPEDITIRPTGNGSGEWEVVSKGASYVMPLHGVEPFNLSDLASAVQNKADIRAAEIEYEQRVARFKAEGDDAKARADQIVELEKLIARTEAWRDTPHHQQAYAYRWGNNAAQEYMNSIPGILDQRRKELEDLRHQQTLYQVEQKTGTTNPDFQTQPNPTLMQF